MSKSPGTSRQTENICTRNSEWKPGDSAIVRFHVIHCRTSGVRTTLFTAKLWVFEPRYSLQNFGCSNLRSTESPLWFFTAQLKWYHQSRVRTRVSQGNRRLLSAQLVDGTYASCATTLCVYRSRKEAKNNIIAIQNKAFQKGVQEMETTSRTSALSASDMQQSQECKHTGHTRRSTLAAAHKFWLRISKLHCQRTETQNSAFSLNEP